MKTSAVIKLLTALIAVGAHAKLVPDTKRTIDTLYPYTGPAIPVGDWVDAAPAGNGKGFPRLVEPPAVMPALSNPTNNINVVSFSYVPSGMHIHYQTPFGLSDAPSVKFGTSATALSNTATGFSRTYDRTPPCSVLPVTQCSQYFHEVTITGLIPATTYYYQIAASNGTTASQVLSFTTARLPGDTTEYTVGLLNDMGYTNAQGTYNQLLQTVSNGAAFMWHGGDISYADDWYSGILPCESDWPVCYNGTSSELPNGLDNTAYLTPLPTGEVANQGGPQGGDMSVLYESNWDLWQQWLNNVTMKVPYMVLPGNHEAACAEFDGPGNLLTAYLNFNEPNTTVAKTNLTYYSCPPTQRNFTAYQNRFLMPGTAGVSNTSGVGNMWYSFNYGLAHFISIDTETDYYQSPSYPFVSDLHGTETHPNITETFITDAGPFGFIAGNSTGWKDTKNYQQYQWLAADLAAVNRTVTPWIIAMGHRPMYSSQVSAYQARLRAAFQSLMVSHGVDAYLAGHIHWYERTYPLTMNGTVDSTAILNNNTYYANEGTSMTHIINGMAGNIESHSTINASKILHNITAVLNQNDYGMNRLKVNATALRFQYILGKDGSVGDEVVIVKRAANGSSAGGTATGTAGGAASATPVVRTGTADRVTSGSVVGVSCLIAIMAAWLS